MRRFTVGRNRMFECLQSVEVLLKVLFACHHRGVELFLVGACWCWVEAGCFVEGVSLGDGLKSKFIGFPECHSVEGSPHRI